MKRISGLIITIVIILITNLTVLCQDANTDTTCMYQSPPISCHQAQSNAVAIVNYPLLLKLVSLKDVMLKSKESEIDQKNKSFQVQNQIYEIDKAVLQISLNRQKNVSKFWQYATGVTAIIAGAFYLK